MFMINTGKETHRPEIKEFYMTRGDTEREINRYSVAWTPPSLTPNTSAEPSVAALDELHGDKTGTRR